MYEKWHVFEVMTQGAYCARPDMTLEELTQELVKRTIHGAPVVDEEERLIGVISLTDVAAALLSPNGAQRAVSSLMSRRVFTIEHSANLISAARKFQKTRVSRLIVTHNDRVAGILSTSDLLDPFMERLGVYME